MNHASDLILVGATMLLALAAHAVGQRVHVPRVTLLLLLGALAGPDLLDLLPADADQSFNLITQLTLAMVGFLLGERMSAKDLRQGKEALIVSLVVTIITAAAVIAAIWWATGNLAAALLLGGISTATAPAATLDVLRESGARGPLTRLVFQVVAIDDAWGAILFSILLVAAGILVGNGDTTGSAAMLHGVVEVAGSLILGLVLGLPMAWLTGRIKPGEPMLLESAGFVFVAAGLASWMNLSYLLTCMTLGVVVANRARHHVRPFRSIGDISEPFLALFFFMAGYQLDWLALPTLGALGVAYVLARVAGRFIGGYLGGYLAGSTPDTRRRIGATLMPQAGVALGLALVATERLPELSYILPLVIGATVVFEIIGPPLTLIQLRKAGETGKGYQEEPDEDD